MRCADLEHDAIEKKARYHHYGEHHCTFFLVPFAVTVRHVHHNPLCGTWLHPPVGIRVPHVVVQIVGGIVLARFGTPIGHCNCRFEHTDLNRFRPRPSETQLFIRSADSIPRTAWMVPIQ